MTSDFSVELAQNLSDMHPGAGPELYILGITHYRAGQHEKAVARLRESLTALPRVAGPALSYPVLAMALHHRGQTTEARQALRDAERRLTAGRARSTGEHMETAGCRMKRSVLPGRFPGGTGWSANSFTARRSC